MNRKEQDVELILDSITNIWNLTATESEVLELVLIIFAENKTMEIRQLEYLLNDETEALLETLHPRCVERYAVEAFELMSASDESDLVDALNNMNYDFMDAVDTDDMVEYLEDRGYFVGDNKEDNLDIVTQASIDELTYNFLSADFEKRKLMLKV